MAIRRRCKLGCITPGCIISGGKAIHPSRGVHGRQRVQSAGGGEESVSWGLQPCKDCFAVEASDGDEEICIVGGND